MLWSKSNTANSAIIDPDFVKEHLKAHVIKRSTKSWFLKCPFHADKDPSLSVIVSYGYQQPVGFWRCFGCGTKGHWNELAEKLGLPTVEDYQVGANRRESIDIEIKEVYSPNSVYTCGKNSKRPRVIDVKKLLPWPKTRNWRGFTGDIIQSFGGYLNLLDADYPLVLLCKQKLTNGGLILCREFKKEGYPSYLFTDGTWSNDYLWPGPKLRPTKCIVMVEGVRDALALICQGLPAVAILGTQKPITSKRFAYLLGLGVETIVLFMDGDNAGRLAVYGKVNKNSIPLESKGFKKILSEHFKVLVVKTWDIFPGLDPCKLADDKVFMARLKQRLEGLL